MLWDWNSSKLNILKLGGDINNRDRMIELLWMSLYIRKHLPNMAFFGKFWDQNLLIRIWQYIEMWKWGGKSFRLGLTSVALVVPWFYCITNLWDWMNCMSVFTVVFFSLVCTILWGFWYFFLKKQTNIISSGNESRTFCLLIVDTMHFYLGERRNGKEKKRDILLLVCWGLL